MAVVREFTPKERKSWDRWVAKRPPTVRALCEKFPPNRLYLLKSSDHRVTIYSWSENGTVTVTISAEFNQVLFERNVFGIKPEDLVECDLPAPDDPKGCMLSPEEVTENIDLLRVAVRPDLFVMGEDGKAVRKN